MTYERCRIPRCRQPYDLIYLGAPICNAHWNALAGDPEKLRYKLKIKRGTE